MSRFLLISAMSAFALAGCVDLAPRYSRPTPAVPQSWPQGGAYPSATASTTTASELAWRDVFKDPRLQTVIAEALKNNRDLRVAILNVQSVRGQFETQRAAIIPDLNAQTGLSREHVPAAAVGFPGTGTINEHVYSVTANVSAYEVDLFGKVRNLTRQALEQYLATDEARKATQISLISEVASAYLTLGADRQRLTVAQETYRSQNASLALTRARFNAGSASQLDVDQAETTVEEARSDIATYTTQAAQDLNALNLLVGVTVSEDNLPTGLEGDSPVIETLPAGISSDVLLRRPDVLEAEHQLRGYNANIGAARAAFFPSLTLTGSGGSEATGLSGLFVPGSSAWTFAPTVTIPIFQLAANEGRLKTAKAQRDVAVAQYQKAVQTAFREVSDALARRGTIVEQVSANQANVAASADTLRLTQARYDRGVDPYLNILVAQRTLYSAQQNLISAKLADYANLVTLYQTLGGGVR
jgi:multidrug efflux system outer membrane protein